MGEIIQHPEVQGSPEWLALRRKYVTSTDVAAILGIHPYRSQMEVWLDKTGRSEPKPASISMMKGTTLEPLIRKLWTEKHHLKIFKPELDQSFVFSNSDFPLWLASIDGQVQQNATLELFEAKHTDNRKWKSFDGIWSDWGEEGSEDIPDQHAAQVLVGMACSGLQAWNLGAIITNEFRTYRGGRDDLLISSLYEMSAKWWNDFVKQDRIPPADGSKSTDRALAQMFPRNAGTDLVPANAAQTALVKQLRAARVVTKMAEADEAQVIQNLKKEIGDRAGLQGVDWKIYWKLTEPKPKPDFERIADHLISQYSVPEPEVSRLKAEITKTAEAQRRFTPYID